LIRLLADENIPQPSVTLLRNDGLDVTSVSESAPGVSDVVVLDRARSEERVLLTFDRDFGELIYRRREPPPIGVIYLRFVPASPEEPAVIVRALLARADVQLAGHLTVVTRDLVRQRRLP
jgi:predicted nuclease of predicted toxin-antitoxin system